MFHSCSTQDLQNVLGDIGGLENEEVVAGLKEALHVGTDRTVERAGVENGFSRDPRIRIPFPPEAILVRNTLMDLRMTEAVEKFESTLNRAAETAAREAIPVFTEAITSMSIQDGFTILRGSENAATNYLHDRTHQQLRDRFRPVVEQATSKVSLTSYWQPLANTYNATTVLSGAQPVDPDLNAYVTERTLDGLFVLLAEEEKRIREDPLARSTELLQRVFAQQ